MQLDLGHRAESSMVGLVGLGQANVLWSLRKQSALRLVVHRHPRGSLDIRTPSAAAMWPGRFAPCPVRTAGILAAGPAGGVSPAAAGRMVLGGRGRRRAAGGGRADGHAPMAPISVAGARRGVARLKQQTR